jgi:tetratricopeptide (TPR) repeat protein
LGETHIVGRQRELDRLGEAIEEAASARGSAWYLTGEPGIGKSFLAEEAARLARSRGMRVFWGRCWEAGGAPAYWPWVQILRGVSRAAGETALDAQREALAQLLPELLPGETRPEHDSLAAEHARFRLMDAVSSALANAAARTPLLLVLEDLHVADVSTVLLLELLSSTIRHQPILILGTFREVELANALAGPQLRNATRLGHLLPLERLDERDVASFLEATSGTAEPAFVEALFRTTDGHPLFLVEVERLWRARNRAAASGPHPIPASVRTTIRERLATVPPETLKMLQYGSIVGREFDIGLLEACHGLGDYAERALQAAEASILVEVAPQRYRFSHFLIREQVYEAIDEDDRSAWHAVVAEHLEAPPHGQDPRWSEVAHHLAAGGRCVEALSAYRRAGGQALRQFAFDEAVSAYRAAMRAEDRIEEPNAEDRIALRIELAHALTRNGDIEGGKRACMEAAALAREEGHAEWLARAALEHGTALQYANIDTELIGLLEETLEALDTRDSALRARVLARLAAATQPSEDPEGPMQLARDGIAMARRVRDPESLLDTLRNGGSAMVDLGDLNERLLIDRELAILGEELDNPVEALRGHIRSVMDYLSLERLDDAFRAIHACERIAGQLGHPTYTWRSTALGALRALWEGRLDEAAALIDEAHRLGREAGDPNADAVYIAQKLRLLDYQGDFDAQLPILEQLSKLELGSEIGAATTRTVIGNEHAIAGREDIAKRYYDADIVRRLLRLGDDSIQLAIARLVATAGDVDLAERLHRRMSLNRDHMINGGVLLMVLEGPVTWGLAWLSRLLERHDESIEHLEHALEVARRSGGRPVSTLIALELADQLGESVEPERARRARALAEEAQKIASELGMKGAEAEAQKLLARLSSKTPEDQGDAPALSMTEHGDSWLIRFGNVEFHVKAVRGLQMLATLVAEPGREFHVIDLSGAPRDESDRIDAGDAGLHIDDEARRQYRARVVALREELAEAEDWNDPVRAERARAELDAIETELSRAVGLGGRARKQGGAAERARVNVQRRIKDAIRRIHAFHPGLAKHLERSVKTGTFCVYEP